MKKFILVAAITLIFTVFGVWLYQFQIMSNTQNLSNPLQEYLGTPEYESVHQGEPLYEKAAIVQIGSRTFKIPSVYIQSNLRNRIKHTGINLLYVLPDFTARADFKNKEEYEQARVQNRFGHMMIQEPGKKAPFAIAIANRKRGLAKVVEAGEFDGLQKEIWYHINNGAPYPRYEIYIETDSDGQVVSMIECSPDGLHLVPGCNHRFWNNSLYFDIHYSKEKYLSKWRQQRQKAIDFIDSFEINSNANDKED